jgi:transcriptional regulator with XRE-family HTH domain
MAPSRSLVWTGVTMSGPSTHPATVELGHRVHVRRVELRMSREQLAEASGTHPNYIGGIERGERNVTMLTLLRLAEALDVNPGALLDGLEPDA